MSSLNYFLFRVYGGSRDQFPGGSSSLRSGAGLEGVLDESCDGDVEDELVSEFDDNPGTTRCTKCSVLHQKFLQACPRVFAQSRRDKRS